MIFNPEPRKGEDAKNSARLPLVFFPLSSVATTTAVARPFRVMVCGPKDRAFSMTSFSFAFAWVTVHVSTPTGGPPYEKTYFTHNSHFRLAEATYPRAGREPAEAKLTV
jgi:hypothetical protein